MAVYRIWPTTNGPTNNQDDGSAYTMGMQFRVTAPGCTLTAIYFWRSPFRHDGNPTASSDAFATACGLYDADVPNPLIAPAESITHPGTTTGWIKHTLATPIALDSTKIYRAAIFGDPPYYSATTHYWDTGAGSAGLDVGPIHVYNDAGAGPGGGGQDSFHATTPMTYPEGAFNASNYWIDIEVDDGAGPAPQNVTPTGISSTEAFGTPSVARGPVVVVPVGIASAQALGTPSVARGAVAVTPSGIVSAETFGTPTVARGPATVTPSGIASAQAFGNPSLSTGAVVVTPVGIASAEVFGAAHVVGGDAPVSPDAFVDAEGILKLWLVGLESLTGAGNPLPDGVHLVRLRAPYTAAWALLSVVGGDDDWIPDAPSHRARISASVYGPTRLAANTAAVAYANTLRQIPRTRPMIDGTGRQLVNVASISGPLYIPDGEDERYLVDADVYITPNP